MDTSWQFQPSWTIWVKLDLHAYFSGYESTTYSYKIQQTGKQHRVLLAHANAGLVSELMDLQNSSLSISAFSASTNNTYTDLIRNIKKWDEINK